jgi:predicted nucleotidyltransferase
MTPEEQVWLDAYRRVLNERFSGQVEELIIYGSKARGDATPDSDMDVRILIRDGDWLEKEIARPGY